MSKYCIAGPFCAWCTLQLLVVISCLLPGASASADRDERATRARWVAGRATFYDDNKQGSCHFGKDIPDMYAAWPDTMRGFKGSCGRCIEVACVGKNFTDNYGGLLERSSSCHDTTRTVVVKIVDSCPCIHQNAYSNRRWCCGDMKHIDLGRAAFKQLAPERWGVIGLKWRVVSCSLLGKNRTIDPNDHRPWHGDSSASHDGMQREVQGGSGPATSREGKAADVAPAWGHTSTGSTGQGRSIVSAISGWFGSMLG